MNYVARTPAQLGQILRSLRKQRDLTQKQAGARVGIKQATVSTVERDGSSMSVATLYKLVAALGLEVVIRDPASEDAEPRSELEW